MRHPEVRRWLPLLLLLDVVAYDLQDLPKYDAGFSYEKVKTDSLKYLWREWENPAREMEGGKGRGPDKQKCKPKTYV